MGRAGEARVVAADHVLHAVQCPFLHVGARDVVPGHLFHAPVHGIVVVPGGHDEIRPLDGSLAVHLVVVDEGSPGGLHHSDALAVRDVPGNPEVAAEDVRVVQELLETLHGIEDLDEPGVVVVEGVVDHAVTGGLPEGSQLRRCLRGGYVVAGVDPSQGPHAVGSVGEAQGPVEGELQVAPLLHVFPDVGAVVFVVKLVGDPSPGTLEADAAVVELQVSVLHEAKVGRLEGGEPGGQFRVLRQVVLHQVEGLPEVVLELRQGGEHAVPLLRPETAVHPSGNAVPGVDLLAAQGLDDLLTVFPHADARHGEIGVFLGQTGHVPDGGVGVEPEEQVRARQVEEGEGMGLDELPHVHDLPQLRRRGREGHAEDGVAGLGGGEMMAHGTDSADAGGDHRHFPEIPALREDLEPPVLGHVEADPVDGPVVRQVHGDLSVAFDAGDGIHHNGVFLRVLHDSFPPLVVAHDIRGNGGNPPLQYLAEDIIDGVRVGRASGNVDIHPDGPVHGDRLGQKRREILAGKYAVGVHRADGVHVSFLQHLLGRQKIPHAVDSAEDGAVSPGNEDLAPLPQLLREMKLLFVAESALDDPHLDLGEGLDVGDGRGGELHLAEEIHYPFVDVEKGHMAARAGLKPDGRDFRLRHGHRTSFSETVLAAVDGDFAS
ncbi:hypothetical protein SDC9_43488 [bioreactor metagenome]|uniref:Uncharacterized protein n=1 Tax=bioreactor metagenome TaxID=1076179 RepID=A0A644W0Q6_9ZZZZ